MDDEWGTVFEAKFMLMIDLLSFICERTKWPSARADKIDNSAAKTAPQITLANSDELLPGVSDAPLTPRSWNSNEYLVNQITI